MIGLQGISRHCRRHHVCLICGARISYESCWLHCVRAICGRRHATYLEGRTRIRSARLQYCTSWLGIRTVERLVVCWVRCCPNWVAGGSYLMGTLEQVVQLGVADGRCWEVDVAGDGKLVEPGGGGDAVEKR